MLAIFTADGLLFVTVVVIVEVAPTRTSPKFNTLGENPRSTPAPDSGTSWGLPGALMTMVIEPVFRPTVVGVKLTKTKQVAFGPRRAPAQVVVLENSALAMTLLIIRVALPVLRSVSSFVLVVLMNWLPNARVVGVGLRMAAVPAP